MVKFINLDFMKHSYLIAIAAILMTTELSQAQDWANLNRFQSENELLAPPKPSDVRVVFMGNSITEGWLTIRPEFFADKPYINRGIGGQTTPQMLLRFRQDVIDLKPSIIVLLAGINDIAGNTGPSTIKMIADNIASMAELAISNDIKVILCSILPAYDFPWRPGLEPAEKVVKLNDWMKNYAKDRDFVYVDYFNAMADDQNGLREGLGEDGIHPNADGYAIMEPLVERAIAKASTKKVKGKTRKNQKD